MKLFIPYLTLINLHSSRYDVVGILSLRHRPGTILLSCLRPDTSWSNSVQISSCPPVLVEPCAGFFFVTKPFEWTRLLHLLTRPYPSIAFDGILLVEVRKIFLAFSCIVAALHSYIECRGSSFCFCFSASTVSFLIIRGDAVQVSKYKLSMFVDPDSCFI